MKKLFFIVLVGLLISSCSMVFNQPTTSLKIYSQDSSFVVLGSDTSFSTLNNEQHLTEFKTNRSNSSLSFELHTNDSIYYYNVNHQLSNWYWGNFFSPYYIGFAVDLLSNKRFTYPRKLYFNEFGQLQFRNPNIKWGHLEWTFGTKTDILNTLQIPEVNQEYFPGNYNGISMGFKFYTSHYNFLSFTYAPSVNTLSYLWDQSFYSDYGLGADVSNAVSHNGNFTFNGFVNDHITLGAGLNIRNTSAKVYTYPLYTNQLSVLPYSYSSKRTSNFVIGFTLPVSFHSFSGHQFGIAFTQEVLRLTPTPEQINKQTISLFYRYNIPVN